MESALVPSPTAGLRALGASDEVVENLADLAGRVAGSPADVFGARVARVDRSALNLLTGPSTGMVARASQPGEAAVGDWAVAVTTDDGETTVLGLGRRRTAISRGVGEGDVEHQVLAANVDEVVLTFGADQPVNAARVERMLALAWESGAAPVLAVTKAELLGPSERREIVSELRRVALDAPVVSLSALRGDGLDELLGAVRTGGTLVFLGVSGAGKSTLVNALTGGDLRTGALRETDHKGRHTTAWRELVSLPGGGAVIDTPGLRQFGLWADRSGLAATFAEVEEVAGRCRFSDCSHRSEPGCAVKEAVSTGELERRRVDHYDKLRREADSATRQADAARQAQPRAQRGQRHLRAGRAKAGQARPRKR